MPPSWQQAFCYFACLPEREHISFSPPFPFGGKIDIPEGWEYLYMGAMNHFYVRESIADKSRTFIEIIIKKIGGWEAFDAIAWLCGVQFDSNE